MTPPAWVVCVSEVVAVVLIVRVWRSKEATFLRVLLSLVALVPLLGPFLVLWIGSFPDPAPRELQVRGPRGRYYMRWSDVTGTSSPIRRFRRWRTHLSPDGE